MSLGLLSPLSGLFQAEVLGDGRLGFLSGVSVCVASLSSAFGAFFPALILDWTGSYELSTLLVLLLYALTLAALRWQGNAHEGPDDPMFA
jgi:hypothetical protein